MNHLLKELQRRNVIKAAISYLVIGFALLEAADIIAPLAKVSSNYITYLLIILVCGFPAWIIFAYIYEWTPAGFKRTDEINPSESVHKQTNKRLNAVIIASLVLAVTFLLLDRFLNPFQSPVERLKQKSIAVLPFENIGEEEDNFFSEGITDDIMTQLSKLEDFRVVSRLVLRDYEHQGKSPAKIGEELKVGHLLVGSIRRDGDNLRISCQLIETGTETEKWAESYDRKMEAIFDIQSEVSEMVAVNLKRRFSKKNAKPEEKPTESLLAYTNYLKGLEEYRKYTQEGTSKAINYFILAVKEDSLYAHAYAALSASYSALVYPYGILPYDYLDTAMYYAEKSIELNPEIGSGYFAKTRIYWLFGDIENQEKWTLKGLEAEPENVSNWLTLGLIQSARGETVKAIKTYQKIIEEEPLYVLPYNNLGDLYLEARLFERSEQMFNLADKVKDEFVLSGMGYAELALLRGDLDELDRVEQKRYQIANENARDFQYRAGFTRYYDIEESKKYVAKAIRSPEFDPKNNSFTLLLNAHYLKKEGNLDSARKIVEPLLDFFQEEVSKNRDYFHWDLAIGNQILDSTEIALHHLGIAVDIYKSYGKYAFLEKDPIWEDVADDPRFKEIVQRVKMRSAQMKQEILAAESEIGGDYIIDIFSD